MNRAHSLPSLSHKHLRPSCSQKIDPKITPDSPPNSPQHTPNAPQKHPLIAPEAPPNSPRSTPDAVTLVGDGSLSDRAGEL